MCECTGRVSMSACWIMRKTISPIPPVLLSTSIRSGLNMASAAWERGGGGSNSGVKREDDDEEEEEYQ